MSRLYAWVNTDMSQEVTRRANQSISVQINYGSKGNSKKAVKVQVFYAKSEDKPRIYVSVPRELMGKVQLGVSE